MLKKIKILLSNRLKPPRMLNMKKPLRTSKLKSPIYKRKLKKIKKL